MSKIRSIKPKELLKILISQGFYIHHQKGSHIVLKNKFDSTKRTVVPMHNKDLKIKTLLSILKEAGIKKENL